MAAGGASHRAAPPATPQTPSQISSSQCKCICRSPRTPTWGRVALDARRHPLSWTIRSQARRGGGGACVRVPQRQVCATPRWASTRLRRGERKVLPTPLRSTVSLRAGGCCCCDGALRACSRAVGEGTRLLSQYCILARGCYVCVRIQDRAEACPGGCLSVVHRGFGIHSRVAQHAAAAAICT